jgi:type IV secretion system protein VirB10
VIDTTGASVRLAGSETGAAITASGTLVAGSERVRASGFAKPSATVPQGVLIPAVLETAFDSNHSGFARAIVSRDVKGFDGTRVLIPRGSRVIGEYQSDVAPGQNRALISWTRLIRPDGITIALDSPSVDTLGRGGVRASVNTHFWDRLGNALLRSTIDIGSGLATRALTGPVVVAVPGSAQGSAPQQTTSYVPTLKVPPGTSISIFVARDLEFPDGPLH